MATPSLDPSPLDQGASPNHCEIPSPPDSPCPLQVAVEPTGGPEQEFPFMALPVEIRLLIYDLLLVSRSKCVEYNNASWAYRDTSVVRLCLPQDPLLRSMEPAILQTCRQICNEALPILYSQNLFFINEPGQMIQFMAQIGPNNTKLVRNLKILIPYFTDIFPWLALFHVLSTSANGLRRLEIAWGARFAFDESGIVSHVKQRGFGGDLHFVRTLAAIQGLEELVLRGYYAKHWPSFLTRRTGAQVRAECGDWLEIMPDDSAEEQKFKHAQNEEFLQNLMFYQRGTENLVP